MKVSRKARNNKVFGFNFSEPSRYGDRLLMLAIFGLCAIGVLMVFSSSFVKAFETYRDPYFFIKQHFLRLGIGMLLFFVACSVDYHRLRHWSVFPLLLCIFALILVLFTGSGVNRWLTISGVRLQPSEFARIALIVYIADWCSRNSTYLRESYKAFLFVIVIIGITAGLVVIEPSYSVAVMIIISAGMVVFLAGSKLLHLFSILIPAIPAVAYLAIAEPYRLKRVLSFLNPVGDPLGDGYQSLQSKIAVGSGKIWGLGFGMSGQKSHFLPEAHCDFIFSILCEERGFIGAVVTIILFILFIWRGIRIAVTAPDQFGYLLAGGLTMSVSLLALVNIAVTLGVLPVTGLPLPFISYGGSALIANLIACGLILSVSRQAELSRKGK